MAVDDGDLDALLGAVRPAVARWRDFYAAAEGHREADRRIWRRWRLQAETTLDLLNRLSVPTPAAAAAARRALPLVVEVGGPAREGRIGVAALVVRAATALGASVVVSDELPPGLAADLAALAAAGAGDVLLGGRSVVAVAKPDGGDRAGREARHLGDADVVVRLTASPGALRVDVHGDGGLAGDVRRAVEGVLSVRDALVRLVG